MEARSQPSSGGSPQRARFMASVASSDAMASLEVEKLACEVCVMVTSMEPVAENSPEAASRVSKSASVLTEPSILEGSMFMVKESV